MDNVMLGLQVAGIGIGGVFCVLVFLMCVFMLVGKLMASVENKKKEEKAPIAVAKPAAPAVEVEDDSEIVAAISAAIMAILSSENNGVMPSFEIKKIKKIKRN